MASLEEVLFLGCYADSSETFGRPCVLCLMVRVNVSIFQKHYVTNFIMCHKERQTIIHSGEVALINGLEETGCYPARVTQTFIF